MLHREMNLVTYRYINIDMSVVLCTAIYVAYCGLQLSTACSIILQHHMCGKGLPERFVNVIFCFPHAQKARSRKVKSLGFSDMALKACYIRFYLKTGDFMTHTKADALDVFVDWAKVFFSLLSINQHWPTDTDYAQLITPSFQTQETTRTASNQIDNKTFWHSHMGLEPFEPSDHKWVTYEQVASIDDIWRDTEAAEKFTKACLALSPHEVLKRDGRYITVYKQNDRKKSLIVFKAIGLRVEVSELAHVGLCTCTMQCWHPSAGKHNGWLGWHGSVELLVCR